jgi:hypothetical protein
MSKKYLTANVPTIITNDIFLASFLHCVGCMLERVERNDRRRVSFVFMGERVRELRESYRTGKVSLDIRLFRDSMNLIRDRVSEALASRADCRTQSPEQRSIAHASTRLCTSEPTPTLQTHAHA